MRNIMNQNIYFKPSKIIIIYYCNLLKFMKNRFLPNQKFGAYLLYRQKVLKF